MSIARAVSEAHYGEVFDYPFCGADLLRDGWPI